MKERGQTAPHRLTGLSFQHGWQSWATAPCLQGSLQFSSLLFIFTSPLWMTAPLLCLLFHFNSFIFFPPCKTLCFGFHLPVPMGDIWRPGTEVSALLCSLPAGPHFCYRNLPLRSHPCMKVGSRTRQREQPSLGLQGPLAVGVQHRALHTQKHSCCHGQRQQLQGQFPLLVLLRKPEPCKAQDLSKR